MNLNFAEKKFFPTSSPKKATPFRVDMDFIMILDSRFRWEQKKSNSFQHEKFHETFFLSNNFFPFFFPIRLLKYSDINKKRDNIQLENTNFLN